MTEDICTNIISFLYEKITISSTSISDSRGRVGFWRDFSFCFYFFSVSIEGWMVEGKEERIALNA